MATDPRVSFAIPARNEGPTEPRRPERAAVVVTTILRAARAMRLVDREELPRLEVGLAEVA